MELSDFDYHLPPELIAQTPARPRDRSRLLVLHREKGKIDHRTFCDLTEFLDAGDLLVLNDTKVIPARLRGKKENTGGKVELLLLQPQAEGVWEAMVSPGRRVPVGTRLIFGEEGQLVGEVIDRSPQGTRKISFSGSGELSEILEELGEVPLPPYISGPLKDRLDYQTIYARKAGSSAAPTAGLHFTGRMLKEIIARGVSLAFLTLHIGLSTFRPIRTEKIEDHEMHPEFCQVPRETAQAVNQARSQGNRVLAVGTTTARALEAGVGDNGRVHEYQGETRLFIRPGHRFRAIAGLLTNFHLPKSTLLLLTCAFGGTQQVLEAYREAVNHRYRFLSFGDAMLII